MSNNSSNLKLRELLAERKKLKILVSFYRRSLLAHGLDGTLELLAKEIKQLLGAERVTIFLSDQRREELYARAAIGLEARSLATLRFPVSQGIAGYVARTGRTANVKDAYRDRRFDPRFDELYGLRTKSVLAAPLRTSNGSVIGVLEVFNKVRADGFTKEDEGLLELVAGQLSSTLENNQLLEQLKRSNLESIYILAQAAEYRDQEDTARHLKRMSDYSTIIARTMGLTPDHVEMVRFASPLHDIGKIAIRDAILRKPGRFTPEEHDEMKRHTILGYEILKDAQSPMLRLAREIALTHHEHFDGTGYPKKLKGEEIPLEARIVALADVFDALTTERVYKPPWPMERVLEFVAGEAGKHFDPKVVEAFRTSVPKIEMLMKNPFSNPGL
ncbi:MAG: HD domain-containing protein [Elusimicrobia bacterium]|nr:HD domain-containing protein [Elusimicrobiota bacterium]